MIRANLHWAPSDTVDVQLTYLNQKSEVDDFSGVNPALTGVWLTPVSLIFPGHSFPTQMPVMEASHSPEIFLPQIRLVLVQVGIRSTRTVA